MWENFYLAMIGFWVIDSNFQIITCHFCFEIFEIDLEIAEAFSGRNSDIYDCVVCCNPNKINYGFYDGIVTNLIVSDGND